MTISQFINDIIDVKVCGTAAGIGVLKPNITFKAEGKLLNDVVAVSSSVVIFMFEVSGSVKEVLPVAPADIINSSFKRKLSPIPIRNQ
jgi:hypothetical protein